MSFSLKITCCLLAGILPLAAVAGETVAPATIIPSAQSTKDSGWRLSLGGSYRMFKKAEYQGLNLRSDVDHSSSFAPVIGVERRLTIDDNRSISLVSNLQYYDISATSSTGIKLNQDLFIVDLGVKVATNNTDKNIDFYAAAGPTLSVANNCVAGGYAALGTEYRLGTSGHWSVGAEARYDAAFSKIGDNVAKLDLNGPSLQLKINYAF